MQCLFVYLQQKILDNKFIALAVYKVLTAFLDNFSYCQKYD